MKLRRIFGNPVVSDATHIQKVIDYRILHALWDEYSRIQSTPPNEPTVNSRRATTPVWTALSMLRAYKGNFNVFAQQNYYYFSTLLNCVNIYNEVYQVLSSHPYSDAEANALYDTHPDLEEAIPSSSPEYRNKQTMDILIRVEETYRGLLKEFIKNHGRRIAAAALKHGEAKPS